MKKIDDIKKVLLSKGIEEDDTNKILQPIINELNKRSYGLVWENQPEDNCNEIKTKFPTLNRKTEINNGENCLNHLLIEGDNLYSLVGLQYTHIDDNQDGRIDVIYIDPPYNTGNKDFKYNDVFINKDDKYRHSKWISFMNKRLLLAKNLLSRSGVIFISIDENEYSQLKLLCDAIFGEENRVATHHIQVRYSDKSINEEKAFKPLMEYILIYAKDIRKFKPNQPSVDYSMDKFHYKITELSEGENVNIDGKQVTIFKKGEWKIDNLKKGSLELLKETWISGSIYSTMSYGKLYQKVIEPRVEEDGLGTLYKIYGHGDDGLGYRYYTGPQKKSKKRGKMYSGVPLERFEDIKKGKVSKKMLPIPNLYDYSADFGNIRHEGGVPFNSGKKPIKMLEELINYHSNKNATVLDFFAGSGSTGHAVLDLNKKDGGHRRFILCTNNEIDYDTEVDYLINNGYISKKPKKNTLKYKTWEEELDKFIKSKDYKNITKSDQYQKLGICQDITYRRLDNILNKSSNTLSDDYKYTNNNLIYYQVNIDCEDNPVKEITTQRVIERFIPYISIKEDCFNIIKNDKKVVILKGLNKVVLICKQAFICESELVEMASNNLKGLKEENKIVYGTIGKRMTVNGIRFKEYPQEIINKINSAKSEVSRA